MAGTLGRSARERRSNGAGTTAAGLEDWGYDLHEETPMERLTPLAAAFLEAEDVDPRSSLAIGSLCVFEGPAPSYDELVEMVAGRLPLIPRYRQKLQGVPFGLAAPGWVDDPDFDIRWHVRNTALPAPGGPDEIG